MNFADSTVQLARNGGAVLAEWRQDCGAGDVITAELSYTVGIISYRWRLIGRPEGSAAAGVGPEPLYLGSSATAAFTVDIPGTYIVECLVNGGSPDATILVGGVAYLESILSPDGLALRLLGPGETDEDNADPLVAQGWIKMLNRWLKALRGFIESGAVSDHKVSVDGGDIADYLFNKLSAGTNITLTKAGSEPHETVQISATSSDHKVSLDAGDTAGYLFDKLTAGANITITKFGAEPNETVQISSTGGGPSTDRLVVADDQPSAVAGALDQVLASDGSIVFSLMPGGSPLPVVTLAALPIPESDVTNLVTDLAGKVSTATTVNGHALTGPISLTAADVGADPAGSAAAITLAGLGGVPTTRQVAGHALSADVTITAADVGADPAGSAAAITLAGLGGVPTSRTINTHALTGNLSLTAADVGADAAGAAAAITLAGLGGIPTSQKGAASGVATLDTNTLVPVTQLPTGTSLAKGALQLGTTTGTACDGADSRLSNARTANAILETSGPTTLTVGAVSDGQFLKRSGATVIGAAASGGSVALSLYTSMMLG